MERGTLTIYSASAGSGKTFRLTAIYLTHLFLSRYHYRKILAVTFTNKATAEMKDRILNQLYILSAGAKSEYLSLLMDKSGRDEKYIRTEAGEILFSILHDYSRFSVSTIDTFFQKVLRAFARETGLNPGFNVELDHSLILSAAVDEMIASSADDHQLREWLNRYVMSNLEEEKSWDLRAEITQLAEELFREKYRILSNQEKNNLENKKFLLGYIKKLSDLKSSFEEKLQDLGHKCEQLYLKYGLTDDMFYQKGKGIPKFIRDLSEGNIDKARPGTYVMKILDDPPVWSSGKPLPQLDDAIKGGLDKYLKEAIRYYNSNIINYISSDVILKNIYALGILSDVLNKVHRIASSGNSFLLSEAGDVLRLITEGDQTPFIYEKIGNNYENYMIDEFQDTSVLQWLNLEPLVAESMGRGCDNLVVGDLKQSIYRWRNSDWSILAYMKDKLVDRERYLSEPLLTNWRSRSNIIGFNNTLFSVIPEQIESLLSDNKSASGFKHLYSESIQEDPEKESGGYVRLEFIDSETQSTETGNKKSQAWKETVLDKLPEIIETFQDRGYRASDIGILVRNNNEGEAVVRRIIDYRTACDKEHKSVYNYNIVSNDSLVLSGSHVLTFIIAVLRSADNHADMISRAMMVRYYLLAIEKDNKENISLFSENLLNGSDKVLPGGYNNFLTRVGQLPLFEAVESIIDFFRLGDYIWNVAYLNAFQDLVLEFTGTGGSDLPAFLEWWETTGKSKSVVLPANQDAARVFTIHKSKGLEFRIVILPFISWNLDHKNLQQPILWLKPGTEPFNELGVVPVRYSSTLGETIFADDYHREKFAVHIDNVNLLYVAMTRAIDAVWGFAPASPSSGEKIAEVLKNAITSEKNPAGNKGIVLSKYYDTAKNIFEFGIIPDNKEEKTEIADLISGFYRVSKKPSALRLKLHGENYFREKEEDKREKIGYGNLMHAVFENIDTANDIPQAVKQLELDGRITRPEAMNIETKLKELITSTQAKKWFMPGLNVMKEAGILLPSGQTRRPDRIIIDGFNATIIDFKFGGEDEKHKIQMGRYRKLLIDMGYRDIKGYLWYVNRNKITEV